MTYIIILSVVECLVFRMLGTGVGRKILDENSLLCASERQ
jgi:hypothetical protein